MFSFITNYLEPVTCFLYVMVLGWHALFTRSKRVLPLLVFYACAGLLLVIASLGVGRKNHNNIWIYDVVILLTAISIGYFFYKLLQSTIKKRTVIVLISTYLIYAVIRNITMEGTRLFDSMGYSIVSASVAIYVFMYFHQILKNVTDSNILNELNFWLAAGYLFYYVGSFIIFVSYYYFTLKYLANRTKEISNLLTALWGVHNVLLFISALSLLIGSTWINYRKKSVSS